MAFLGDRLLRLALEALRTQIALFAAGQLLHDADAAHRHEIACDADRSSPLTGRLSIPIFSTGSWQLPCRDGSSRDERTGRVLRGELPGPIDGPTLSFLKVTFGARADTAANTSAAQGTPISKQHAFSISKQR